MIDEEGITELADAILGNNAIFYIDLRDNPFSNTEMSRKIILKLAENIQSYKFKHQHTLAEQEISENGYRKIVSM